MKSHSPHQLFVFWAYVVTFSTLIFMGAVVISQWVRTRGRRQERKKPSSS